MMNFSRMQLKWMVYEITFRKIEPGIHFKPMVIS